MDMLARLIGCIAFLGHGAAVAGLGGRGHLAATTVPGPGVAGDVVDTAPAGSGGSSANESAGGNHALFIAGLEGTLHHFWFDVFAACAKTGRCRFPSIPLRVALWKWKERFKKIQVAWAREGSNPKSILYLNMAGGYLSYPNRKPDLHPRLDNYARAAAANGDTLKVIVMLRDAKEILRSSHGRFGRTEEELVTGAAVLLGQLQSIQRDKLMCVDVSMLPLLAGRFNSFLMDARSGRHYFNMKGALKEFYKEKSSKPPSDIPPAKMLGVAMQKIRDFCGDRGLPGFAFPRDQEAQVQRVFNFTLR